MKKKIRNLAIAFLMLWSASASATTKTPAINETHTDASKAILLLERLDRLNEVDKTSITQSEKKAMRREVKSIQKQLKQLDRGVYMSVGAVIIILLLLILLL